MGKYKKINVIYDIYGIGGRIYKTGDYVEIALDSGVTNHIFGKITNITDEAVILIADTGEDRGIAGGEIKISDIVYIGDMTRPNERMYGFSGTCNDDEFSDLPGIHCADDIKYNVW